jgi:hypothetical protein
MKGKTLYLDKDLYEKSQEDFSGLNIKKLTGTVVSSDPEQAACSILYYKNFSKRTFSLTDVDDKTATAITILATALLANVSDCTIYKWGKDYRAEDVNLSYPTSTEIDKLFSELAYLLHMYKDISYTETIITSFSSLTKYIFGYIYQQLERDASPKTLNIAPEFYREIERITNLKSESSTVKGVVFLTSIIYFILKGNEGKFVEYLQFLRKEKSVNISRINRPLTTLKGERFNLLYEWNVVCSNTDMETLLGDDWSDLMKRQRKLFDEYRRGKDTTPDLKKIEAEIQSCTGSSKAVVYSRQKRLHNYVKHLRETSQGQKSGILKKQTLLPNKSSWRDHCLNTEDKSSLCEITIPLIKGGYIKTESELLPVIIKGKCERSIQALIFAHEDYSSEPWYIRLGNDATNNNDQVKADLALSILQTLESKTFKRS